MKTSPVFITVYNRHVHFKKCIESLKNNDLANKTHLFVAIDAPSREEHQEDNQRVVEYAKSISGFKEITLFLRKTNLGARENAIKAYHEIFSAYDRVIRSEDDNVFAPNFLSFINKGLNIYEDREDIFSISGYNYPIIIPPSYTKDIYIWTGFSAWGFGCWKKKWQQVDWSESFIASFLRNKKEFQELNAIGEHYVYGLRLIQETGHITGDTVISYYLYKNNMYSVFPTLSRVRNIGHDGTGLHCGYSDLYRNQAIYEGKQDAEMPYDIKPDQVLYNILRQHFRFDTKNKIKIKIKSVLKSLGLLG